MPRHKRQGMPPQGQQGSNEVTQAYASLVAQQSAPEPKPSLKAQLFQKVSDAFPDQAVAVVNYDLGHAKLQNRGITVPHIGVKVSFTTPKGNFAVAGMLPENADDAAVTQLLGRLKADAIKYEDTLTPKAAI